jgi:hypothetical protein
LGSGCKPPDVTPEARKELSNRQDRDLDFNWDKYCAALLVAPGSTVTKTVQTTSFVTGTVGATTIVGSTNPYTFYDRDCPDLSPVSVSLITE